MLPRPSLGETREHRARTVARMRELGYNAAETARLFGVSRSYVSDLSADPTGWKNRARRAGYAGTCACGGRTDGSNGRDLAPTECARCAAKRQREERYWTRETIAAALRAFAAMFDRVPTATDLNRSPTIRVTFSEARNVELDAVDAAVARGDIRLPAHCVTTREFGSIEAARRAAGLVGRVSTGGRAHRAGHQAHLRIVDPVDEVEPTIDGDVCPRCGDYVKRLVAATGWCRSCNAAAG